LSRIAAAFRYRAVIVGEWLFGQCLASLFALIRRMDPDRALAMCGAVARRFGPWLPVHRVGERQLRAAFPDRDDAWIAATLTGAWENLGRVAGEFAHLERLWDYDPENPNTGRIVTDDVQAFITLHDDGLPALIFAAHLGNWELPALIGPAHGLASAVVYRLPNNPVVARRITAIRRGLMGRMIRSRNAAVFEMATALEAGEHLGMLVDQHWSRGVDVTFFGRRCKANPTLARFARQYDCPVYGVRVIRLPGQRFRIAATGPVQLPRDAAGGVDVAASTQMIATIVEGWIREHPDQWLWFHRRWR
jgi:KDO2-lipid IV(A) lauroyltransferase